MNLDIKPASDSPIPDLVELLNLSFDDYLIPFRFEISQFLNLLRRDTIDLASSRVLLKDKKPAGIALISRRGWASRVAALGIIKELRGKKAGSWLMERLITESRERKDREMVLEVIEQNEPAVRLYKNHGFDTMRRLISLVHQGVKLDAKSDFQEIDLREMGQLISKHGQPDLPWQLSGETIGLMNPPTRAYQLGESYISISNPDAEHVVIWSLLVEPSARGKGLGVNILKRVIKHHSEKIWRVPAIWPEEFGILFERAGFQREKLSQWQMRLLL